MSSTSPNAGGIRPLFKGGHGVTPPTAGSSSSCITAEGCLLVSKPTVHKPSSPGSCPPYPESEFYLSSKRTGAPPAASDIPSYPETGQPISCQPTMSQNTPGGCGNMSRILSQLELEPFTEIDQLLVHQEIDKFYACCVSITKSIIKNSAGQILYSTVEETDCLSISCSGTARSLNLKVLNCSGKEVIHLYRPYLNCQPCYLDLQTMEVRSQGVLIGTIEQLRSFSAKFVIKNENGDIIFKIKGPFCTKSMGGDVKFRILSSVTGEQIGQIDRKWSGLYEELLMSLHRFDIRFPMDLDVRMKAVLLGACILIDFTYYKES